MRIPLAILLALCATPALAQFPPPGLFACANEDGSKIGELTVFVAGDYSFKGLDGNAASGQLASAGTTVNPLSGPLKDMDLVGWFAETEDKQPWYTFENSEKTIKIRCV
jgi:hypothetical protein